MSKADLAHGLVLQLVILAYPVRAGGALHTNTIHHQDVCILR